MTTTQDRTKLLRCGHCGTLNRVPVQEAAQQARCGKCHEPLTAGGAGERPYMLRCSVCHAKNRVPAAKLQDVAHCGKCKAELAASELLKPNPVMVSDATFDAVVRQAPLPVLLYCYSNTCPTCVTVGPMIDQFAADARGRIRVAKLNVTTSPQTAARYNVLGVPFLFIFDNGQLKESLPGALEKHDLMLKMAHYL